MLNDDTKCKLHTEDKKKENENMRFYYGRRKRRIHKNHLQKKKKGKS